VKIVGRLGRDDSSDRFNTRRICLIRSGSTNGWSRQEVERQPSLSLLAVERMASALVLPNPEREEPGRASHATESGNRGRCCYAGRAYLIKGFTLEDERLKQAGGGNYFDELPARLKKNEFFERFAVQKVLQGYIP